MQKKRAIFIAASGALMALLLFLCINLLLRNLGPLIAALGTLFGLDAAGADQFSTIFGQLSDAVIQPPKLTAMICGFGSPWLVLLIAKPRAVFLRILLQLLLFIILFTISFCVMLLLTNVNGVRFISVLLSLLTIL